MKVGIVAQPTKEQATTLAAELHADLAEAGHAVLIDEETATILELAGTPVEEMADCPLVVSIGGDGTFLFVARHVGSTPIMGVNLGEVGFLNAVSPDTATEAVREELRQIEETGSPHLREVVRLEATATGVHLPEALNEIVVQGARRGHGAGCQVNVDIDGHRYADGQADGVLVATPTGSTAYNLSEGGPLLHPAVDGLVVTGMAAEGPIPSLVVSPDRDIDIGIEAPGEAVVVSDGQYRRIETPATISVGLAEEPGRIAGQPANFFDALGKLERSIGWEESDG